eukprot:scaffold731_cov261-Pinguiococcus_pyrenoidosus.AAC.48
MIKDVVTSCCQVVKVVGRPFAFSVLKEEAVVAIVRTRDGKRAQSVPPQPLHGVPQGKHDLEAWLIRSQLKGCSAIHHVRDLRRVVRQDGTARLVSLPHRSVSGDERLAFLNRWKGVNDVKEGLVVGSHGMGRQKIGGVSACQRGRGHQARVSIDARLFEALGCRSGVRSAQL